MHTECEIKSPMCSEAVKMSWKSSHQTNASSIPVMRESNATSSGEDVHSHFEPAIRSRRLAKSFAVLTGWFKSIRAGGMNPNRNDENLTKTTHTKRTKRNPWNIFKLNAKKMPYDATPSYQHFEEPLNIERPSLAAGKIDMNGYCDAEWYDLNKDEMSFFEARVSSIVSSFNSCNKISVSNRANSDESSHTLWSQNNLSTSCKSNDENRKPETTQTSASTEHNHFASVEQMVLINDIMTKPIDFDGDCNSDESCKLSSGFGSDDSDTNSPREFVRKFQAFTKAIATSDFYENDSNGCLPISAAIVATSTTSAAFTTADAATSSPIVKNMQKMSKKHRTQINSRKLFGIPSEEHMPSLPANVTPQNKSRTECQTQKVRNGTPFKVCCPNTVKPTLTCTTDEV